MRLNLTSCTPFTHTRTRLWLLTALVAVAAVAGWADGYTTIYAVQALGASEVNPIAAALMGEVGLVPTTFWTAIGWTAWVAGLLLAAYGTRVRALRHALVASLVIIVTGKLLVVVNNLNVITGMPL